MINILTFSICVLFQTSSKKACEKNNQQETGQPHQAKSTAVETFTISEENWIKKELLPTRYQY